VRGGVISISYSTAVDILTDLMIMALPIRMIRDLQVNRRQKAALAGIFSVSVVSEKMVRRFFRDTAMMLSWHQLKLETVADSLANLLRSSSEYHWFD